MKLALIVFPVTTNKKVVNECNRLAKTPRFYERPVIHQKEIKPTQFAYIATSKKNLIPKNKRIQSANTVSGKIASSGAITRVAHSMKKPPEPTPPRRNPNIIFTVADPRECKRMTKIK